MGERRERTLPGRQDRWLVAKSPRAHRAPAPGRLLPPPPLNQVPGRDRFSLLQRVLPVQRLKQPGFSQLLFTCLDREMKHLFILHHPPPRAGKHQQKAGCPGSLLSPSQPPPTQPGSKPSLASVVPILPVGVTTGCRHLYLETWTQKVAC